VVTVREYEGRTGSKCAFSLSPTNGTIAIQVAFVAHDRHALTLEFNQFVASLATTFVFGRLIKPLITVCSEPFDQQVTIRFTIDDAIPGVFEH